MKDQPQEMARTPATDWSIQGAAAGNPGLAHLGELARCQELDHPGQPGNNQQGPLYCNIRQPEEQRRHAAGPWTGASGSDQDGKQPGPLDWNIRGAADQSPGLEHLGMERAAPDWNVRGCTRRRRRQRKQEQDPKE